MTPKPKRRPVTASMRGLDAIAYACNLLDEMANTVDAGPRVRTVVRRAKEETARMISQARGKR